jgi:hypothetical protein
MEISTMTRGTLTDHRGSSVQPERCDRGIAVGIDFLGMVGSVILTEVRRIGSVGDSSSP